MDAKQKPQTSIIYPSIERDKNGYWHPVITVKERGTTTWAVASVDGVIKAAYAHIAAQKEARRLELQSG